MNYDTIRAKIQVPQELDDMYQRGVLIAMKILFDDKSHQMLLDHLKKGQGKNLGAIVGNAAAGTVGHTFTVMKGQFPPDLTIPLGVEVCLQMFQFMDKAGMAEPTPEDFSQAMSSMIAVILGTLKQTYELGQKAPKQPQPQQPAQPGMIQQGA